MRLLVPVLLAALALPPPASAHTNCVTLPSGIVACGSVVVEPLVSSASAEGSAAGSVTWTFTLRTTSPTCGTSHAAQGVAYAHALRSCSAGCAFAALLADGVVVDEHGLC